MKKLKKIIKLSTLTIGLSMLISGISTFAMELDGEGSAGNNAGVRSELSIQEKIRLRENRENAIVREQMMRGKDERYARFYADLIVDYGYKERLADKMASDYLDLITRRGMSEIRARGYMLICLNQYYNGIEVYFNLDEKIMSSIYDEEPEDDELDEYESNYLEHGKAYADIAAQTSDVEECIEKYNEGESMICINHIARMNAISSFHSMYGGYEGWREAELYERELMAGRSDAYATCYAYLMIVYDGMTDGEARRRAEIFEERVRENGSNASYFMDIEYYMTLRVSRGMSKGKATIQAERYARDFSRSDYEAYIYAEGKTVDIDYIRRGEDLYEAKLRDYDNDPDFSQERFEWFRASALYYAILINERGIDINSAEVLINIYMDKLKETRNSDYSDYYTMLAYYGAGYDVREIWRVFETNVREGKSLLYSYVFAYATVVMRLNGQYADMLAMRVEMPFRYNQEGFKDGIRSIWGMYNAKR